MLFKRRNQREAFEKEAERVFPSVYGTALRLTRSKDDAEDLSQEAMIRAYEAFDRFDGTNFRAWMLRIVTNLYINKYRQKQRGPGISSVEAEGFVEPAGDETQIPDRVMFDQLLSAEVEEALKKVPEDFRITVLLSDIEGLSYQEVADMTNVPIGTVRSRLARGRTILRNALTQYAVEEGYIREGMIE